MWHNPLRFLLASVLLASLAAAARAQTGAAAGDQPVAAPAKAKRLCDVEISSPESRGRGTFSATEILDLDLRVVLRKQLSGDHLLRVDVLTPNGHLYQTLTVPFTSEETPAKALRAVEGFPRPLAVQPAEKVVRGGKAARSVTARLPVGGTPIVHAGLYGKWSVRAFLDDDAEACGPTRGFRIGP